MYRFIRYIIYNIIVPSCSLHTNVINNVVVMFGVVCPTGSESSLQEGGSSYEEPEKGNLLHVIYFEQVKHVSV